MDTEMKKAITSLLNELALLVKTLTKKINDKK